MKSWTVCALFIAVLAVFVEYGHTEVTGEIDDFKQVLQEVSDDAEPYVENSIFLFLILKRIGTIPNTLVRLFRLYTYIKNTHIRLQRCKLFYVCHKDE